MVTDMQTSLPSVAEIWTWLDSISDPEIPVLSVIDLGIVRDVKWTEEQTDFTIKTQRTQRSEPTLLVTITPTYSGCPAMAVIKTDMQQALRQHGISRVRIDTQLSPAWTTDWMTERGKKRLVEYGIAPPQADEQDCSATARGRKLGLAGETRSIGIPCPRCGSSDTRLVSRFGSTPCKAFYICNSCLEPFDHFKCH
jgi:ring-1,2-phenylacetyl-CoA epoxidase subunit PaaD